MSTEKLNLVLDKSTVKDIIDEIYRKFQLHTDNISIHFDSYAIQILVFPGKGAKFILPDNEPVDVRLDAKKDQWEWIGRQRAY